MGTNYTAVNIRPQTAERLRKLKIAASYMTGRLDSYSDIIDDLIENTRKHNPALYEAYIKLGP